MDPLRFEVLAGNPTDRQIHDINELLKQLTSNPKLIETSALKKMLDQSGVFVVVITNTEGRSIAMATLAVRSFLLNTSAMIEDVVVDSKYRGIRLGKNIMEHLITMAREKGCSFISLTSHPRRKETNHMYQELGFELIGKIRESNYYRLYL
ncbi:MAG: GNAT family N-acetyltransferase [Patescibacteria group bacterium]